MSGNPIQEHTFGDGEKSRMFDRFCDGGEGSV